MSRICGMIQFNNQDVHKADIMTMMSTMSDCEYDAETVLIDGNAGFGHKLLWTTSESMHEKHPLVSKDDQQIFLIDGRIDDREMLIQNLELKGKSDEILTDAKLIMLAYQKWQQNCMEYLVGDFAFVVWDKRAQKLFMTRDRIGVRQLYYCQTENAILFASEAKAILALIQNEKIDRVTLKQFLDTGAIERDASFFENIKRIPSSNYLVLAEDSSKIQRYWYPEKIKTNQKISMEEAAKQFKNIFIEVVKSHRRSHYPVSVQVSGGLDSSSIYAVSQQLEGQNTLGFTIAYAGTPADETDYISMLEKKFHSTIERYDINNINFSKYNLKEHYRHCNDWPEVGNFLEFHYVNREIQKKGVRVILTGIGADEVLALSSENIIMTYLKHLKFTRAFKAFNCIEASNKNKIGYLFYHPLKYKLKQMVKKLIGRDGNDGIDINLQPKDEKPLKSQHNLYLEAIGFDFLTADFSKWIDFNAMHYFTRDGVEVRSPFFDTRIIEFVASLPLEYFEYCGTFKSLLIQAMDGIVPAKLLHRKSKACLVPGVIIQVKQMQETLPVDLKNAKALELIESDTIDDQVWDSKNVHKIIKTWESINLEMWLRTKSHDPEK